MPVFNQVINAGERSRGGSSAKSCPFHFRALAQGLGLVLLALGISAGCVSRETVEERNRKAYEAGYQQGLRAAERQRTHVLLRGTVQNQLVPWREGLTLAQAIVEAVYTARQDPVAINITRDGRIIPVSPQDLMRGIDVPLAAGDTIDIR